jgi:hypothetical protein
MSMKESDKAADIENLLKPFRLAVAEQVFEF